MRTFTLFTAAALLAACASASDPAATAPPDHATEQPPMSDHDQHRPRAHHDHRHGDHGHHRFDDAERWVAVFDAPERDAWQRPDEVVAALVTRDDLRVIDLGAGTGYFAARFARAVPNGRVTALDVEPDMVSYLTERVAKEGLDNLEARRVATDGSDLEARADLVFLCNTYHHIDARVAYFTRVARDLGPSGRLAVVDFHLDSERGPPRERKLSAEAVEAELREAGFTLVERHDFLPDQYLLVFSPAS